MMQLILIALPTSMVGLLALVLCLAPRSGIAGESATTTVTRVATATAYTGASVPVFAGLTADQVSALGIIGGLLLGFLTFAGNMLISWWFKSQHLKLAQAKAARGCDACMTMAEDES